MPIQEGIIIPTNTVTINGPTEVVPLTIKNQHCMEPWGCVKGHLMANLYSKNVTLSNKTGNGLVFSYDPEEFTPAIGNYIFQDNSTKRSWITHLDDANHTITVELPVLEEGQSRYVKGYYIDQKVRDWKPVMYLWGSYLQVKHSKMVNDVKVVFPDAGGDDFVELSIVDHEDLFKNEDYVQAVFGCSVADAGPILISMGFEDNGEYGHWTKYYDESWIANLNGKLCKSPDGAPGEIIANLWLRISYFTGEIDDTMTCVYVDYTPTSKED